jgi:neutral ceramidase
MQGTHADVAPAIRPGQAGHLEARRIGTEVGAEAARLYDELGRRLTDHVELATGLREIDLDTAAGIDGVNLPRRPAVGAALIAGATENVTPVIHRIRPFKAGSPKRLGAGGPQGAKWVLGSRWLQPLVIPLRSFPRILPVQLLRIGDLAVIGLPFEITVETGRRTEEEVARALAGSGVTDVAVSSVANEYSGYAATAEEYGLQYYEGGHTLYGPLTQAFLTAHAARLATEVARDGLVSDVPGRRHFDLRLHHFLPRAGSVPTPRIVVGAAEFTDPSRAEDGHWELRWIDVAPGDLHWHEPLVRVECADGDGPWGPATRRGRRVDDAGCDLEVTHLGPAGVGHEYRVRWYDPELRGGRRHRFVLTANAGQPELVTEPFD